MALRQVFDEFEAGNGSAQPINPEIFIPVVIF